MIPTGELESALKKTILQALQDLKLDSSPSPAEVGLELPRNSAHGDLACSAAMQLASRQRKAPAELAQAIAGRLEHLLAGAPLQGAVERIEVKPPGFINLFLSSAFLHSVLREVLSKGDAYGRCSIGTGRKVLVEFVSANPTGPLSVAHGRQAVVGDTLAHLLSFAGYEVAREYYLNDEGTQIDLLGASILARAREAAGLPAQFPENGYKGGYVGECGQKWLSLKGRQVLDAPDVADAARRFGVEELTGIIRGELDRFGVRFDRWVPQSSLDEGGYLHKTLDLLKQKGFLFESEGAWWLKSTAFGDDKDRVVIRSDGRLTYVAADIAYHRRKFERGFQLLVNLWGPDHHGYILRLKAAVQALGFPGDALQIRIVQLCTLRRGKETLPMSTREGQFITLTQVMNEVGLDAARFFFLLRKTDAHLEFDLELAKKHSLENPVYYIQYAYARITHILAHARKEGVPIPELGQADPSLLTTPEERSVLASLRRFPAVVEMCAKTLEPFGLTTYLQEAAESLHRFYDAHRVLGVGPEPAAAEGGPAFWRDIPGRKLRGSRTRRLSALAAARLDLVRGVQVVLANGLRLLGVSTPEKM